MPLLRLDADAHPFLLVEVEGFAFVGPDPGLFCGVAGEGIVSYVINKNEVYCVCSSQCYVGAFFAWDWDAKVVGGRRRETYK